MSPLIWLLPILVVTVLAAGWTVWAARPRGPADPIDSVQAHQRFVDALARKPLPEKPLDDHPQP